MVSKQSAARCTTYAQFRYSRAAALNEDSTEDDVAAHVSSARDGIEAGEGPTCCLCLDEFQCGDEVLWLPCAHYYHKGCIAKWMIQGQSKLPR